MERQMRRFKQMLPKEEVIQILSKATNGVLSLTDTDGYPYGVPLSFCYDGDKAVYFHCARHGRKMGCIARNGQASFCVVAQDDIKPEEFTTYFKSVILSGKTSVVDNPEEVMKGLRMLGDKYSPGIDSTDVIAHSLENVAVIKLEIEAMSGKEAIELTRKRTKK